MVTLMKMCRCQSSKNLPFGWKWRALTNPLPLQTHSFEVGDDVFEDAQLVSQVAPQLSPTIDSECGTANQIFCLKR